MFKYLCPALMSVAFAFVIVDDVFWAEVFLCASIVTGILAIVFTTE